MDALIFAGEWQQKQGTREDGRFPLVDEMQEIAKQIAPDWPQYSITRTNFMGANSRFVTPYEHPVCSFGAAKHPVFAEAKEVEGHPGVYALTYRSGIKPILETRNAPTPKDPGYTLVKLAGFEADKPKKSTKKKSLPADGGAE